ncbi:odorant receptor 85b-like [Frieseomelitta varia]|uniref:odorant receptor 85b-like n=1 Tax=Frieseomelitta varia TaxID=561572 RepID=UPI001CB68733|nr:odorant receptor 85b-like [Frieseomelitta varia]
MTNVTTMFTSCYIGQLLIDEASIVKKVSNTLDWYRLPVKKARSLIMIIISSNCPIKVTAANIADMSLATFTDIIKTAMGYFNVLRSTI